MLIATARDANKLINVDALSKTVNGSSKATVAGCGVSSSCSDVPASDDSADDDSCCDCVSSGSPFNSAVVRGMSLSCVPGQRSVHSRTSLNALVVPGVKL